LEGGEEGKEFFVFFLEEGEVGKGAENDCAAALNFFVFSGLGTLDYEMTGS